jgi:hypothetical protein
VRWRGHPNPDNPGLVEETPADGAPIERVENDVAFAMMFRCELTFDVVDHGLVDVRTGRPETVEAADVLVEANRLASTCGAGNEDMPARYTLGKVQ